MKHRFTIPFPDGSEMPDIGAWFRAHGWSMQELTVHGSGVFSLPHGELSWLRVRVAPFLRQAGAYPGMGAELTVCSGTTLVYDDAEDTMGVTLKAEPEDAVPAEPPDAVPGSRR